MVDTSPFPAFETASQQNLVLRNKDANATFNIQLTEKLVSLCEQNGVSYQFKDQYVESMNVQLVAKGEPPGSLGSTEMGRIISASNGLVDGTTLQIPTSGYHTMSESAPLKSVGAFIQILSVLAGVTRPDDKQAI